MNIHAYNGESRMEFGEFEEEEYEVKEIDEEFTGEENE